MTIKSKTDGLTGKRYGRLVVGERIYGQREIFFQCKCDCGNTKKIRGISILRGTKSCGCLAAEKTRERQWRGYGKLSKTAFNKILESARKRDLEVKITIKDAWNLFVKQKGKCAISGVVIGFGVRTRDGIQTASLDRIDSKKEYTKDNIQWVHKNVQTMKWDFEQNNFINWCILVAKYNEGRNENR